MRHFQLIGLLGCAMLTASCAARIRTSAPQIEMPAEASRPCRLYRLPDKPTQADLEIGYASRGAALVSCDAARRLAVQTHEAEHALEAEAAKRR